MGEKLIVRPITDDGMVGYDQFGQLMLTKLEDGRQVSWGIADVRRKTCVICNHGWLPNAESMADQRRWDLVGDHVHGTCLARHVGLVERSEFFEAIVAARISFRGLVPEPNRYWNRPSARPWYHAELIDHPARIVIGSRKRVFHVELVAEGGVPFDWWEAAKDDLAAFDVTKEFSATSVMLHAWGNEQLRLFISRLAKVSGFAKGGSL
jgi:hypothetical protein